MQQVLVQISGITPLIVNRFHEDAQQEATGGVHTRKERPAPEADATERLYSTDDGAPYFPSENLRRAIISAASRTKIGRRSAVTDVAAAIFITPFALPIEGQWHVDSRPVVIPATRGRILRHRPMFDAWRINLELQIDVDLIDAATIRKIMDDAGNYVGIGDFRPEKKGPYGRFRVDSWQQKAR